METEPQPHVLRDEGCYAMQGNFISHPVPGEARLAFLAQSRNREEEMTFSPGEYAFIRPAPDS